MPNDYYNTTEIVPLTRGRSRVRNDEFNAVEDGFDLLPSLSQMFGGLATFAGDSTGSSNAYAVTMPETRTSNADGEEVVFIANHTNTGAATLNVDGIGAVSMVSYDGTALEAGDIVSGLIFVVRYDASNTRFQLVSPTGQEFGDLAFLDTVDTAQIEDDAVTTDKIADGNVTLAKLANMASDRLLGRDTAGSGAPEALTVGGGLGFTGSGGIEIQDDGVTTAKIADGDVTTAKMGLDAGLTVAGGDIVVDAGDGLDFSANTGTSATGASTTSEVLDFYEEGEWTPELEDLTANQATLSTQEGKFTRIGRVVHIEATIVASDVSGLTGPVYIQGLPYVANATSAGSVNVSSGLSLDIAAGGNITGDIEPSTSQIQLWVWDSTAGCTRLGATEVTDNGSMLFSGSYMV